MNILPKILIFKLGAIGDTVMALSLLTAIDEKYPGAEITWICGEIVEPILAATGRINKLITVNELLFYKKGISGKIRCLLNIWSQLGMKKFDIVLNCYRDRRYKSLLFFTRYESYLDFGGKGRLNQFIPGRYHSDEYARMISGKDNNSQKSYTLPKVILPVKLELFRPLMTVGKRSIILAPGGAKNFLRQDSLRRWPVENYAELARRLVDSGFSVLIAGGESDNWVLDYFKDIAITNLIGKEGILDLISIFNDIDILVTHDTGTLHLAKLSKIKIIALFGPVNPRERIGINDNCETIWPGEQLPCAPCYDGKNFAECSDNLCMKMISVSQVLEKITECFN